MKKKRWFLDFYRAGFGVFWLVLPNNTFRFSCNRHHYKEMRIESTC